MPSGTFTGPSIATRAGAPESAAKSVRGRDLRLDFFRGLALLIIFVDHVSGNGFSAWTLQGLGFADGAEVFVFIAGMAGVYAYRSTVLEKGFAAGAALIFARIRKLYFVHLLMVVGVLLFAVAALLSGTRFDAIGLLGLQPLLDDPAAALTRLPLLAYMPNYLDILPLYIALFAILPLIIVGMKRHPAAPVAVLAASYAAAHFAGVTLPNLGRSDGWFLNPFAWALLFAIGAAAAELTIRGSWSRMPRAAAFAITAAAAAYVALAFLHQAPWRTLQVLDAAHAFERIFEPSKVLLSWHRLADILAKAWLVSVLVPRQASFMNVGFGNAVSRIGRHSLPIFVAGTFLALAGSVALYELGGGLVPQIVVTFGGIALLLALGQRLDARRQAVANRRPDQPNLVGKRAVSAS